MKKENKDRKFTEEDVSRREFFVKAIAGAPIAASVVLAGNAAVAGGKDPDEGDDDAGD